MRVKLGKGKQRELLLLAKNRAGLTWKELADSIGHCEGYTKNELFKEKIIISERAFDKLCDMIQVDFDKFIVKKFSDNWGQVKGGKLADRKPRKPKLLVTKPSAELAEVIGLILGDGNIWVKKGYYYVRVAGHLKDDKEYLLNFVKPLISKVFGCEMQVQRYKKGNKMMLSKASKDLVFTLSHFGLPSGNKKKNNVGIPDWIFESDEYIKSCIRGLIDTDGSVCPITGRNYSYIWFRSAIPALRKSFSEAMETLEIKIAKWSKKKESAKQTFIGGKADIIKYRRDVGFSNPKHIKRFNAPVV